MKRLMFAAMMLLLSAGVLHAEWKTDVAYETVELKEMGDRFVATSPDGTVHITAGGDSLYHFWYDGTQWMQETIEEHWSGTHASLTIDAQGYLHIAYQNWKEYDLKYATNQSGSWVTQVVDAQDYAGWFTSIASDQNGELHISYTTYTPNGAQLMYAVSQNGLWATEIVDSSSATVGEHSSLQVDSMGNPHISYLDTTNKAVKYAMKQNGLWQFEQVAAGLYSWDTSLDLGSDNIVNIAYSKYIKYSGYSVELATRQNNQWTTQTFSTGHAGYSVALENDRFGHQHLIYTNGWNDGIQYANNSAGEWQYDVIENVPNRFLGMGIDQNGMAYLSACNYSDALMYMSNSTGTWEVQQVVANDEVGFDYHTVFDGYDFAHIVDLDEMTNTLRYITNKSGTWDMQVVDIEAAWIGYRPYIAVDNNGSVHISAGSRTLPKEVLYYTNRDGNWTKSVVDSGSNGMTAIEADSAGRAHLIYGKEDGFYHSVCNGNACTTEMITDGPHLFDYFDTAIDENDRMHIVYEDDTSYLDTEGNYIRDRGVYYASNQIGNWVVEKIVDEPAFTYGISIDVVPLVQHAHIVFQSNSYIEGNQLKYMTNKNGSWALSVVDVRQGYGYGDYSSVDVDTNGKVHIGYMEWLSGNLLYANDTNGSWAVETMLPGRTTGWGVVIDVDAQNNAQFIHADWDHDDILHTYIPGPDQPDPALVDYPGNSENGILCHKGERGAQVEWMEEGHFVYKPSDENKAVGKNSSEQLFYNAETGQCEPRK